MLTGSRLASSLEHGGHVDRHFRLEQRGDTRSAAIHRLLPVPPDGDLLGDQIDQPDLLRTCGEIVADLVLPIVFDRPVADFDDQLDRNVSRV